MALTSETLRIAPGVQFDPREERGTRAQSTYDGNTPGPQDAGTTTLTLPSSSSSSQASTSPYGDSVSFSSQLGLPDPSELEAYDPEVATDEADSGGGFSLSDIDFGEVADDFFDAVVENVNTIANSIADRFSDFADSIANDLLQRDTARAERREQQRVSINSEAASLLGSALGDLESFDPSQLELYLNSENLDYGLWSQIVNAITQIRSLAEAQNLTASTNVDLPELDIAMQDTQSLATFQDYGNELATTVEQLLQTVNDPAARNALSSLLATAQDIVQASESAMSQINDDSAERILSDAESGDVNQEAVERAIGETDTPEPGMPPELMMALAYNPGLSIPGPNTSTSTTSAGPETPSLNPVASTSSRLGAATPGDFRPGQVAA